MGNICSGAPELDKNKNSSAKATQINAEQKVNWKDIQLKDEVHISIHQHPLRKLQENAENKQGDLIKKRESEGGKNVAQSNQEEGDESDQFYGSEDDLWFCNGGEKNGGLRDGCKSGQTDFGRHPDTVAYLCTVDGCDYDMCELCIKWIIWQDRIGTPV